MKFLIKESRHRNSPRSLLNIRNQAALTQILSRLLIRNNYKANEANTRPPAGRQTRGRRGPWVRCPVRRADLRGKRGCGRRPGGHNEKTPREDPRSSGEGPQPPHSPPCLSAGGWHNAASRLFDICLCFSLMSVFFLLPTLPNVVITNLVMRWDDRECKF